MKTFTIRVENDSDAELLKSILQNTKFIEKVEAIEDDTDITEEEFRIIEERLEQYEKNPAVAVSFEEFNQKLKEKYGK
jgi:hypothetical protein